MRCAAFAHATHEHFYLLRHIASRQLDPGHYDLFETHGIAAAIANKVYMVVAMLSGCAIVLAQRVPD